MQILVIEDDAETAAFIADGLGRRGHAVELAGNGDDGLERAGAGAHELLIVDRMLPGIEGRELVQQLRRRGVDVPVLFLTALGGVDDRVEGLECGGDDYMAKPFAMSELVARVHALGRRLSRSETSTRLCVADLELDLIERTVQRAGRPLALQPREFRLLEYLMRHAGEVVTRTMLLENVWQFRFEPKTSVVETHVSRLRVKVDREFSPELIHTVRGVGYCLRAPE